MVRPRRECYRAAPSPLAADRPTPLGREGLRGGIRRAVSTSPSTAWTSSPTALAVCRAYAPERHLIGFRVGRSKREAGAETVETQATTFDGGCAQARSLAGFTARRWRRGGCSRVRREHVAAPLMENHRRRQALPPVAKSARVTFNCSKQSGWASSAVVALLLLDLRPRTARASRIAAMVALYSP